MSDLPASPPMRPRPWAAGARFPNSRSAIAEMPITAKRPATGACRPCRGCGARGPSMHVVHEREATAADKAVDRLTSVMGRPASWCWWWRRWRVGFWRRCSSARLARCLSLSVAEFGGVRCGDLHRDFDPDHPEARRPAGAAASAIGAGGGAAGQDKASKIIDLIEELRRDFPMCTTGWIWKPWDGVEAGSRDGDGRHRGAHRAGSGPREGALTRRGHFFTVPSGSSRNSLRAPCQHSIGLPSMIFFA